MMGFIDKQIGAVGQKIGINLKTIVKDSSWIVFGKIVIAISSFVLVIILSRVLDPIVYGKYKFVLSLFGIIMAFSLTGISTAITQAVARGYEKILWPAFKLHLKWASIMTLIAFGIAGYYTFKDDVTIATAVIAIAIFAPFLQSFNLYVPYLQGRKLFQKEALFGFWHNVLPAIIISLVAIYTKSFLAITYTFFISYTLVSGWFFFRSTKIPTAQEKESDHKQALGFGKHLSLMNIFGGITSQLDKILIFHFLGGVQLAIYTVSLAAPQQIRQINKVLSTVALTRMSKMSLDKIKSVLPKNMLVLFLASLIIVIAYVFAAPFLFKIFFPNYLEAVLYTRVYSLMILFLPFVLIIQTFFAHTMKKTLYWMQIISPLTKTIALFILLPIYGIMGAIASIFIAEIIRTILIIVVYVRITTNRPPLASL